MKQDVITDNTVETVKRKLRILRKLHNEENLGPDDPRAVQRFDLNEADVEIEMSIRSNNKVGVYISAGRRIETDRQKGGTEFDQVASDLHFVLKDVEGYNDYPRKVTDTYELRGYEMEAEPISDEEKMEDEWEDAHEEAFDD